MSGSVAARELISGSVSSLMAATTTVRPWARAASSRRKGKRPLPAIRPSFCIRSTLEHFLPLIRIGDSIAVPFSVQENGHESIDPLLDPQEKCSSAGGFSGRRESQERWLGQSPVEETKLWDLW